MMAAWGFAAFLLFVAAIGCGLVWCGIGFWRSVAATWDGIPAVAKIDALEYTGNYITGRFFAMVSFRDAAGADHTTRLSLAPKAWTMMREGNALHILYSAADPLNVSIGGKGFRRLSRLSAIIFIAIGIGLTLFALWVLIAGLVGWIEVDSVPLPPRLADATSRAQVLKSQRQLGRMRRALVRSIAARSWALKRAVRPVTCSSDVR